MQIAIYDRSLFEVLKGEVYCYSESCCSNVSLTLSVSGVLYSVPSISIECIANNVLGIVRKLEEFNLAEREF